MCDVFYDCTSDVYCALSWLPQISEKQAPDAQKTPQTQAVFVQTLLRWTQFVEAVYDFCVTYVYLKRSAPAF